VTVIGRKLFPYRGLVWGGVGFLVFCLARPCWSLFSYGLLLVLGGEILRLWGVGYIKNYRGDMESEVCQLVTSGPYAYMRNPLYLANGIIGIGITFLSGLWWSTVLFLLLFVVLYGTIVKAEEAFLEERFQDKYRLYRECVPAFGWRLPPYRGEKQTFSWRIILKEEVTTLVTLFLVTLLFYWRGFGFLRLLDRLFFF